MRCRSPSTLSRFMDLVLVLSHFAPISARPNVPSTCDRLRLVGASPSSPAGRLPRDWPKRGPARAKSSVLSHTHSPEEPIIPSSPHHKKARIQAGNFIYSPSPGPQTGHRPPAQLKLVQGTHHLINSRRLPSPTSLVVSASSKQQLPVTNRVGATAAEFH